MSIGSIENHRAREEGVLIYPVYSRRSRGLSLGINLFPDQKRCPFDCPYCEVFPFKTDIAFSQDLMETQLRQELAQAQAKGIQVQDICFSGNGEPTLSPTFPEALARVSRIRKATTPATDIVVITNGAGLLEERLFTLLRRSAENGLKLWLKLDAGTESWYHAVNRSPIPYPVLQAAIRDFTAHAPATIQTMRCKINGCPPPQEELDAWEQLIAELADGTRLEAVQIYGKARPAPEDPLTEPLPGSALEALAQSLKKRLGLGRTAPTVQAFP